MEVSESYEGLQIYLIQDILKIVIKYLYLDNVLITRERHASTKDYIPCYDCNRLIEKHDSERCCLCNVLLCTYCYETNGYTKCSKCVLEYISR
jgi:hypothetical protein